MVPSYTHRRKNKMSKKKEGKKRRKKFKSSRSKRKRRTTKKNSKKCVTIAKKSKIRTNKKSKSSEQKHLREFLLKVKRSTSSPQKFHNLMLDLDEKHLSTLAEVVFNVVTNPHSGGKHIAPELLKHKTDLRYIASSKKPLATKRRKILQIGHGVIGTILRFIVPVISGLFSKK